MKPSDEYTAARTAAAIIDLSQRGQIELSGPDATPFLHNLCTNDINGLSTGRGCEFFLCTNKARVVAHGFAHRLFPSSPPVLWLDVDPGTAEKVVAHLNHFIVSEQVVIADRTGLNDMLHVCGPTSMQYLDRLTTGLPALENLQHVDLDGVRVARHDRLAKLGFDILCESARAEEWKQRLIAAGVVAAGPETFNILRVETGVPVDGIDFDAERFVVEIGRIKQAISYTKGCYLGQEPIVMARDRGHANRTLMGLRVESASPVQPGAKVTKNGEEVGQVTSSVSSPLVGSAIAVAYLKRGSQEAGTGVEVEGMNAVVTALPFTVE